MYKILTVLLPFTIFILGGIIQVNAQSHKVDSLKKALSKSKNNVKRIDLYNELSQINYHDQPQQAIDYALEGLQLAQKTKNDKAEANLLNTLGLVYFRMRDLDNSKSYAQKALTIQKKIKDQKGISKSLHTIGLCLYASRDYQKALDYYIKSLKIKEKLGLEKEIVESYTNIALVWGQINELEKAEEYYQKAYDAAIKYNQPDVVMKISLNLSLNYLRKSKFKQAQQYADTTLKYANALNVKLGIGKARGMKSRIFLAQKKYKKALEELFQAREVFKELNQQQDYAFSFMTEANIQDKLNNLRAMEKALNAVSPLVAQLQDKELILAKHAWFYKLYKKQNRYKEAVEQQDIYVKYKDTLYNEKRSKQIAEMQEKYESEKKEQEIQNLSQKSKIQSLELDKKNLQIRQYALNLIILSIVMIALLLGGLVYYLLNRQKQLTLRQKTQEIEQKLLRLQMNPHFIFNAMTAIQEYMLKTSAREAGIYLAKFSKLIRQILENTREEYISLDQEINTLENYLSLQNLRQKQTFEYQINISEDLDREEIAIPPMFAQPFIENAIEHGISPLKEKGKIDINFTLEKEHIILEIKDNGIGIQESTKIKTTDTTQHKSLATQITRERIEALKQSIKKTISFNIQALNQGTKVVFYLPYQYI